MRKLSNMMMLDKNLLVSSIKCQLVSLTLEFSIFIPKLETKSHKAHLETTIKRTKEETVTHDSSRVIIELVKEITKINKKVLKHLYFSN